MGKPTASEVEETIKRQHPDAGVLVLDCREARVSRQAGAPRAQSRGEGRRDGPSGVDERATRR